MTEYWLYPKDDEEKFFEICADFEKEYPMFNKEELLVDPLDDQLIQAYNYQDKKVIITLERLWFYEIIARSDIDLTNFARKHDKID